MNISFKKDINKSLMVIEKIPDFSADSFMMKMLSKNAIPGLLPIGYENLNGQYNLLYDISSRQAFSKVFETKKLSFRQIKALIFSLKGVLKTLEEYLLDSNNIILKQECIFTDPEGENYEYCYDPYYHGDLILETRELFTRLLSLVDYEDEKAVRLVYEMHSEVKNENFTIDNIMNAYLRVSREKTREPEGAEEFMDLYEEEMKDKESEYGTKANDRLQLPAESKNPPLSAAAAAPEELSFMERFRIYVKDKKILDVLEDINNGELREKVRQCGKAPEIPPAYFPEDVPPLPHRPELEYISFGENLLLNDLTAEELPYHAGADGGTILLNGGGEETHRLVGRDPRKGLRFEISKIPFTIGKSEKKSDAWLDEPTVSRLHARIYEEGSELYIEDLNSTNGTFVNEERLSAYTKTRLKSGDILRFAAEEFCFQ